MSTTFHIRNFCRQSFSVGSTINNADLLQSIRRQSAQQSSYAAMFMSSSALPARYLLHRASAKELPTACVGYTRSHECQWLRIALAVWHWFTFIMTWKLIWMKWLRSFLSKNHAECNSQIFCMTDVLCSTLESAKGSLFVSSCYTLSVVFTLSL